MAAGSTYTPIATYTAPSAVASYYFTGIPSTYTDLILILNGGLTTTTQSYRFQLNTNAGNSDHSYTYLAGNGTSASSGRATSTSGINAYSVAGQSDTQIKSNVIMQIQNYSNTTTYKTCLIRGNTDLETAATVGLYRSTSAISSLYVGTTSGNIQTGTTMTLYGIAKA